MSVWKKAQKSHQKTPRERHQPEERQHLGLLEKKKDYIARAKDYNTKKTALKLLRKRALNKNPDEFHHHMINSHIEHGKHVEAEVDKDEDTPEQLKFKRTEDLKYITFKRTQELKKIDRLQSQLHLISVDHGMRNKKTVFPKNLAKENKDKGAKEALEQQEISDVNFRRLEQGAKKKRTVYKELAKRVEREKELAIIQEKLSIARRLESDKTLLKPKRIEKGTKTSAPIYKWKYERKK